MSYLDIFGLEYLKSAPSNFSNSKIISKNWRCLNLGQKMSDLGIFGLEFEKDIVIYEISKLQFVRWQSFSKKKMPKFETKNDVLKFFHQNYLIWVCFGWNLKTILSYLKSAPSTKVLKFATKKDLFAYFWAWIWKQCCHIWDQHTNLTNWNIFGKNKNANISDQKCCFRYFCVRILKKYCHIWNPHPQTCLFAKFH